MKKWLVVLSSFVLVVSYQNCAQNPGLQDVPEEANVARYEKYSTESVTSATLWDNKSQRLLDLDLTNGKIEGFEEYGNKPGQLYCLRDGELESLNNFLKSAEVCEPVLETQTDDDVMCSTVYKYPYAALLFSKDEVRLGESMSGCDVPTDLCGDKAAKFKNFVSCVIDKIDERGCGNSTVVEECRL